MGPKVRRWIVAALTMLSIAAINADEMAQYGGGYGPPRPSYGPPPPRYGGAPSYGYPVGSIQVKGKFGDELKGKVDSYGDLFSTGLEEMKKNVKALLKLEKFGNKGDKGGGYGGFKTKNKIVKGAQPVYGHYKVNVKGPSHYHEPQYPDHYAPVPPPYYGLPPKKHYGAPSPSYGAPVSSYGPPVPAYEAPAPSYGAPAPSYGPPAPTYEAPAPSPSYGAPAPSYGPPPPPSYRAPELAYEAPAPSPSYGAPAPSYEAPAPSPSYGAPAPSYEAPAPSPSYGAPAPAYEAPAPSSSYGAPVPPPKDSYGPPVPVHSHPAPAPASSYEQGVTRVTYATNDQTPVVQGNYNDQTLDIRGQAYNSQPAASYQPQPPLLPSYAELPLEQASYATRPPPTYNPVGQGSSFEEEYVEPPKKVKASSPKKQVVVNEYEEDPRPVFVPKRRPISRSQVKIDDKKEHKKDDDEEEDQKEFVVFSNPADVSSQGGSS